jgi:amino acid adenylation domain-containing protein
VAADADLRLLITDGGATDHPPGVATVSMAELSAQPATLALPHVDPGDPAYVIYTSGTTGNPKGVIIPHGNVLALLAATREPFELGGSDVWTGFHSFAFDFSVWEIWGCLLTGGRLVLVPYWTTRSPAAFVRLLREQGVTVLSQTPSAFANLIPHAIDAPLDLRLVTFGGEALRTATLVPWLRHHPIASCRLVNLYGITETTVHVTSHDITAADVVANSCSVGRPLAGWSVSIRSPDGRILPFGVAGEICVGGAGLALGYLGRPELTAERFPFDADTGERYYRSGDLGLLNPDGTLGYRGRLDDQVKIRGYRVELGEIRAALVNEPDVREAVVTFREDDHGGAIHAYLTAAVPISPVDLRRRLRIRLPDYMVPTGLHVVGDLPLTPNGKADLAVLEALTGTHDAEPSASAATGDERDPKVLVHRVWSELFGPDAADKDFLDLGGTSLQALRIASVLSGIGGRSVDPRDVYMNPSVDGLVSLLEDT